MPAAADKEAEDKEAEKVAGNARKEAMARFEEQVKQDLQARGEQFASLVGTGQIDATDLPTIFQEQLKNITRVVLEARLK